MNSWQSVWGFSGKLSPVAPPTVVSVFPCVLGSSEQWCGLQPSAAFQALYRLWWVSCGQASSSSYLNSQYRVWRICPWVIVPFTARLRTSPGSALSTLVPPPLLKHWYSHRGNTKNIWEVISKYYKLPLGLVPVLDEGACDFNTKPKIILKCWFQFPPNGSSPLVFVTRVLAVGTRVGGQDV